jgi:2-oxoglutarate ferredoxin oxidoreductase subunit beta
MTYLAKPKFHHPALPKNALGFTHRDYEGSISTLCAGCGHDSISASIIQACFELNIEPHRLAKLSGIGCSSKTPDYFLGQSHGFNSVHGRMPSVLTGANMANKELIYLGVSGDGDSASIGLGQFIHCVRRGVNMLYVTENNGVYGLTRASFSATADKGSKSKAGGPTMIRRSISWACAPHRRHLRRPQLFRRQEAARAAAHGGIEPSGTGLHRRHQPLRRVQQSSDRPRASIRTRSTMKREPPGLHVTPKAPITVDYDPGTVSEVTLHDGSTLRLSKLHADYDPHDRIGL